MEQVLHQFQPNMGVGGLPPAPKGLDGPEISRQLTQTMCGVDIFTGQRSKLNKSKKKLTT